MNLINTKGQTVINHTIKIIERLICALHACYYMIVIIYKPLKLCIARSQIVINQTCCSEFYKTVYKLVLNYVVETKCAIKFQKRRLMTTRILREGVFEVVRLTLDFWRLQEKLILLDYFRCQNKFHLELHYYEYVLRRAPNRFSCWFPKLHLFTHWLTHSFRWCLLTSLSARYSDKFLLEIQCLWHCTLCTMRLYVLWDYISWGTFPSRSYVGEMLR